jgi:hypothetical protein
MFATALNVSSDMLPPYRCPRGAAARAFVG